MVSSEDIESLKQENAAAAELEKQQAALLQNMTHRVRTLQDTESKLEETKMQLAETARKLTETAALNRQLTKELTQKTEEVDSLTDQQAVASRERDYYRSITQQLSQSSGMWMRGANRHRLHQLSLYEAFEFFTGALTRALDEERMKRLRDREEGAGLAAGVRDKVLRVFKC